MNFDIVSPKSREELLQNLQSYRSKNSRIGAGYTDLLPELKKSQNKDLTVINLAQIKDEEFTAIAGESERLRIGAMVTAARICKNDFIATHFPVLHQAAEGLASAQIRQVATVGGNICQASPSGDLSCALVSLQAVCEILQDNGSVREEILCDFFKGPGQTTLRKNEVLKNIYIPVHSSAHLKSGYIKIGKRNSMECSIVSIGFHFYLDEHHKIEQAGIALGAVGSTIIFSHQAAGFLKGKIAEQINNEDRHALAELIRQAASPIDDIRASAWYRNEVLYNCSLSIFE